MSWGREAHLRRCAGPSELCRAFRLRAVQSPYQVVMQPVRMLYTVQLLNCLRIFKLRPNFFSRLRKKSCCWAFLSIDRMWIVQVRSSVMFTLVVTSGYFSCRCLSIISYQSVHSRLTFDINKAFSSTQLPLSGYFLFFGPFSMRENPSRSAVFEILIPGHLAPTNISRSKSLKSLFFLILMLGLNFSKSSSPHLDAWMHWLAAMWLADLQFVLPSNWTGVPKKLTGEFICF